MFGDRFAACRNALFVYYFCYKLFNVCAAVFDCSRCHCLAFGIVFMIYSPICVMARMQ